MPECDVTLENGLLVTVAYDAHQYGVGDGSTETDIEYEAIEIHNLSEGDSERLPAWKARALLTKEDWDRIGTACLEHSRDDLC